MKREMSYRLLLAFSALLICGGVVSTAYALSSTAAANYFSTGLVDISITEDQEDNGVGVLPGDVISQVPKVKNNGNGCYVRARVMLRAGEGMEAEAISDVQVLGMPDGWVKAGDGYYYYKEALPHGAEVDIFRGVEIPVDLPQQETEEKPFHIDITVDAIQDRNFTPSFTSSEPWGNVEIIKAEKDGSLNVGYYRQSGTQLLQLVYQGDAGKLFKNRDNFFENLPALMPGDVVSDTVELEAYGNEDVKLYFKSEVGQDLELFEKLRLKLTVKLNGEEKVLYEGNLEAEALSGQTEIGALPKNAKGEFRFEISMPEALDNSYTAQDGLMIWTFSTEPIPEEPLISVNADTGDLLAVAAYIVLISYLLVLLIVIWILCLKKWEGNKDA